MTSVGNRLRLTDAPEFESEPLISPEGSRIAFARETANLRHIWIMDRDGKNQAQVTHGRNLDFPSEFSPDGQYLLFNRGGAFHALGITTKAYLIHLNKLTEPRMVGDWASFAPNSMQIVYGPSDRPGEIWIMDIDGGGQKKLGTGDRAVVSPASDSTVAIEKNSEEVWLQLQTRKDPVYLCRGSRPMFTPAGDRLLYTDGGRLFAIEIGSGQQTEIKGFSGEVSLAGHVFHKNCLPFRTVDYRGGAPGHIYILNVEDWSVREVDTLE